MRPSVRREAAALVAALALLGAVIGGQIVLDRDPSGAAEAAAAAVSWAPGAAATDPGQCPSLLPIAPRPSDGGTSPQPPVPEAPVGWDGTKALVPPEPPAKATICRYGGAAAAALPRRADAAPLLPGAAPVPSSRPAGPAPLQRQITLVGDLSRLAADLSALPARAELGTIICDTSLRSDPVDTLLRLDYADGRRVWVHADDRGCGSAGNGRFASISGLSHRFDAAVAEGTWIPPIEAPDQRGCTNGWYPGRVGQGETLIPGEPAWILICEEPKGTPPKGVARLDTLTGVRMAPVLAALRALSSDRFAGSFHCTGGSPEHSFELYVGYASGPGIQVRVNSPCDPEIVSFARQAQDPGHTVRTAIEKAIWRIA